VTPCCILGLVAVVVVVVLLLREPEQPEVKS